MSLGDIRDATLRLSIVREAHQQASARLADILDTKKTHEQKAHTLFTSYITVSLALMGASGAIWDGQRHSLALAFGVAGVTFVIGAICFMFALNVKVYGALGSNPSMWLEKITMEGDDSELARMLAYVTFYHQDRIKKSIKANDRKALWIRAGIFSGVAAPLVLAGVFVAPSLKPLI